MSVCTRHLRYALLHHPIRGKVAFTKAELDPVISVIKNGGKHRVPDDGPLHKYFSYVPEFGGDHHLRDMDGDGDIDFADMALYGLDRITEYEKRDTKVHDAAAQRIEEIAMSAGMQPLDRSEWFKVNLGSTGNAVVTPPQGDAAISVFVRGHRLCRERAAWDQTLRDRLDIVSTFIQKFGFRKITVDNAALAYASDQNYALLKLPIRIFRSRIERMLRRSRQRLKYGISRQTKNGFRICMNGIKLAFPSSKYFKPSNEFVNNNVQPDNSEEPKIASSEVPMEARNEIFEHVLVIRRDTVTGEILFIKLFKEVPRHKVTLLLPTSHATIASSEQVLLLTLIGLGSVMPTYRSVHFALAQPWVANLVWGSLAASILKIIYSSFQTSHAYVDLEVHKFCDQHIAASGGHSVFSVLRELAEEVDNNATLLAYVNQKLSHSSDNIEDAEQVMVEWLKAMFPERTACDPDWALHVHIVSATSRLFALGLCTSQKPL